MKSQRSVLSRFAVALVFVASFGMAMSGCKSAQKKDGGTDPSAAVSTDGAANAGDSSDTGGAMGLKTVNFPYDSFTLTGQGKSVLKNNAQILKDNTGLKIQVEGHCDQRGGIQYNIALGEKRANAVKKYLEDMGITGDRISTISYGKERPIDPSESEEAYAKNRRANFVITSR